jgi:phosphoribosyl 1,2-cyclic phosphate phosphodiesterase
MKVTILGSGTSTGIPMVGCTCPVCTSTDPRDSRTRASLLVEHDGHYILVDTSTDLRIQAVREKIPHIDAVLFTHAHADHIHGIDDLRGFHFLHRRIIPCYGSRETLADIAAKFTYIFTGKTEHGYHQLLEPHAIDGAFNLLGLRVIPVPLLHGTMPSTGFRFGNLAYLTDCSSIPESSMPLLRDLDILIIDGLRHTPHPHHFNVDQAIRVAQSIAPQRTYITHLTHEISQSEEEDLPGNIYYAYDGLTFSL